MGERKLIRLDAEDRARVLAKIPLFAGCDDPMLRSIAEVAHLIAFDDGQVIVPEGEKGQGFYVLLSGEAQVRRDDQDVARLATGDFFGEVSLVEGTPRIATVTAIGHTVCLGILRTDFRALLVRQPRIALRIIEAEGKRIQE
jgi:CRP-like cAMP-binding protein